MLAWNTASSSLFDYFLILIPALKPTASLHLKNGSLEEDPADPFVARPMFKGHVGLGKSNVFF